MITVRWGPMVAFLLLTFVLSWGLDLVISNAGGEGLVTDLGMTPLGMLVPAAVAFILRRFWLSDSALYTSRLRGPPGWIVVGFLFVALAYAGIVASILLFPNALQVLAAAGAGVLTLWTLLVFWAVGRSRPEALRKAGLALGDLSAGRWFVLGAVGFLLLQAILNLGFGLGRLHLQVESVYGLPTAGSLHLPALVVLFVGVAVIGVPLSGLAATFGEEYGWRGFLQDELMPLGPLPAVFLVGLIWGLWHIPVIRSGAHTYPPTISGILLGLAFFTLWGFIQSYSVLKTGGIWVAAFLHGVVNSVYGFLLSYVVRPGDMTASFGLGVPGLLCLALVVACILRDPLWRASVHPRLEPLAEASPPLSEMNDP